MRLAILLVATLLLAGACAPAPAQPTGRPSPPLPSWTPGLGQHWQIQLGGTIDETVNATFYDLDPFTASQETVEALNAQGRRTICHLDVGVSDEALPDASRVPAGVLGAAAGTRQRWLDIRAWSRLRPVLENRLDLCRAKGFQGVDADMAYGYAYHSGFDLTASDQRAFDLDLVTLAHGLRLDIAVRTTPTLATAVEPITDFAVVDGCVANGSCDSYRPYVAARKVVLDLETGPAPSFCPLALYYRFAAVGKPDGTSSAAVTTC